MSSVQPANGLPEPRMITADSFRALKLKLAGARRQPVPSRPEPPQPDIVAEPPAPPAPAEETATLPEPAAPLIAPAAPEVADADIVAIFAEVLAPETAESADEPGPDDGETEFHAAVDDAPEAIAVEEPLAAPVEPSPDNEEAAEASEAAAQSEPPAEEAVDEPASAPLPPPVLDFVERRVIERPQQGEKAEAGVTAHALLDIMAIPTEGSLPQERALANDTLLRLIPRMPLKSLRHLAERVCMMEAPSQMLVRRLINDPRIEVSGPLLEHATTVDDSDLIAVAQSRSPAKLKLIARRRVISPALAEALIQANDVETLIYLLRNQGASFSIESMWHLTRFAAAHPVLQAPLVTRQDTPSPIAFQLFWRLPSELRRYVLSRFLTDSETITRILSMNRENDGGADRKPADPALLEQLAGTSADAAGEIYSRLTHVSPETGARIADDAGGEALTVALKAAGLTRAQFGGIIESRPDAEALKAIFETLSFNKARVLLTYWDWAAKRTGPYARIAVN